MKRLNYLHVFCVLACLFFTCTNLTNPFLDKERAMAKIADSSLGSRDTVKIFSTYNVKVNLYLREHLDSFKLHIDKNRLFGPDTVVPESKFQSKHSFSFSVSFFDTGRQSIQVISYKNDGTVVTDSREVYVKSPLHQAGIKGGIGDSIRLSTKPVGDQVIYVWDFHNGIVIREYSPSVKIGITSSFTSQVGELYVEDLKKHRSPSVFFSIVNSDQAELKVVCINDSVLSDSVYSTTSSFKFSLEVSGAQRLKSARVNGKAFSDSLRMGELFVLNYNLKGLDTITKPVKLDISVTDNLNRNFSRSFFIHYVKILPVINVLYPVDSMQTSSTKLNLLGNIGNFDQYSKLYLLVKNNGADQKKIRIMQDNPVFSININLPNRTNHISLIVFPDSQTTGTRLAETDFYVFYNPEFVDTTAPQIRGKRCNGEPVETNYISRTDSMLLELDIVDNSKLTVTVNGKKVSKKSDDLYYSTKVFIAHGTESTPIYIDATDSAGYSTKDTLFVKHNRLPVWINTPSYSVITTGKESVFDISVSDPDNDSLFVIMTIIDSTGKSVILNAGEGKVSWTPQLSDVGVYDAVIRATDGFESIEKSFVIVVKGIVAVPVKFLTSEDDFPDTVYIGKSINVTLREVPLTGTKPFEYAAYFLDSNGKIVKTILKGSDSLVQWTAERADTIVQQLKVTVKDSCGMMDSIVTDILVMKEIVAFLRWENIHATFNEGASQWDPVKLIMTPALESRVSIPYTISFPATNDAADSSDISSPLSGKFVFDAGDTVAVLNPEIFDDSIPEVTERFEIRVTEPDSVKFRTESNKVFYGEIIDNDIVLFYFNETEAAVVETDTTYPVIIKLSRPVEKKVEFICVLDESSTATAGKDFTLDNNYYRVTFDPGDVQAEIKIHIRQDQLQEQDETVILKLVSDDPFTVSRDNQDFTLTIHDDGDVAAFYSFTIEDSSGSEAVPEVKVKVKLDKPLDIPVVLQLSVTDSNMISGYDYRVNNGSDTLIIAQGTTERELVISIVDDTIPEDRGFIRIDLSSNSDIVQPGEITSFRYNVTPNEIPVMFNGTYVGGNEWPATYTITVRVEGNLESDLIVYYKADSTSTATEGSDYTISNPCHCVTIPRGNSPSANMEFKTLDDDLIEGFEIINFVLTEVSNKKIAYIRKDQSVCTVRIDDNEW